MSSTAEIMGELKALSQHYPRRQLSASDQVRWFEDYAADLAHAGFDAMDVRVACTNWRTSPEKHMPTPGQLLAYCRRVFRAPTSQAVAALPGQRDFQPVEKHDWVSRGLRELAETMRRSNRLTDLSDMRRPGETQAQQAERLWPSHRTDRMRARAGI